jgi:hypothetical protein
LDGSLWVIVTGDAALLAIAASVGDPFAPFVVGEDRRGYEDGDHDGE